MGIGMNLGNYCNDGGCVMRGWDLDCLPVCVCVCVCVSLTHLCLGPSCSLPQITASIL